MLQALGVLAITIATFVGLGFVAWCVSWMKDDVKMYLKAKRGEVVVLTFEQYLALHTASPTKYPLRRNAVDGKNGIEISWPDIWRLQRYITKEKQTQELKKANERTLRHLREMTQVLTEYREKQDAENAKAVREMLEHSIGTIEGELKQAQAKAESNIHTPTDKLEQTSSH